MIEIILLTNNSENHLYKCFSAIEEQTISVNILVIDSSSTDNTLRIAEQFGVKITKIPKENFNHGGTRNLGLHLSTGDIVIFLTPDAILANPKSLENLIESFQDEKVGAAYGRQLPRPEAGPIEAHARLFNYPAVSRLKTIRDAPELGIKTAFFSNSFAAYRRSALTDVGLFPSNTIFGEDTIVAGKMFLAGWKIAYCAEAEVYHSHHHNHFKEFQRYFDIGVLHAQESWLQRSFGKAEGGSKRFVISEKGYTREYFRDRVWYCSPDDLTSIRNSVSQAFTTERGYKDFSDIIRQLDLTWENAAYKTLESYKKILERR